MPIRLLNPQRLYTIWSGLTPTGYRLTPLVSIQNPDPEKIQEVSERELTSFSVLKKTESKSSSTLFFLHHFPPMPGTLVFSER